MKSFEEFYNEMMESDVLKEAFKKAAKAEDGIKAFLEEHDVEDNVEEFVKKFSAKMHEVKELTDEELDKVAGGFGWSDIGSFFYSVGQTLTGDSCLF